MLQRSRMNFSRSCIEIFSKGCRFKLCYQVNVLFYYSTLRLEFFSLDMRQKLFDPRCTLALRINRYKPTSERYGIFHISVFLKKILNAQSKCRYLSELSSPKKSIQVKTEKA